LKSQSGVKPILRQDQSGINLCLKIAKKEIKGNNSFRRGQAMAIGIKLLEFRLLLNRPQFKTQTARQSN
jgi:hypothetical protein